MKKFIALLLALLTVCACSTALAAPVGYESEKNYMCEDFEDADNTMIGKEDSPVAKAFDKHDMDPYYFADGTMEITNDGENGSKGLKLIPDYYSDLQNGSDVILRTQLQRVCATLDESKREEVRKAWGEATGFSFYVRNETAPMCFVFRDCSCSWVRTVPLRWARGWAPCLWKKTVLLLIQSLPMAGLIPP